VFLSGINGSKRAHVNITNEDKMIGFSIMTILQLIRHSLSSLFWPEIITDMEHPSYSPDLALNDFWLFPKIKSALNR
jgi:hypothetical protein